MSKHEHLRRILSEIPGAVVAFSGGVDSTYLLYVAREVLGQRLLAVTASSEIHPEDEVERARELAGAMGVLHLVVRTRELELPAFSSNPPDRCYHCKRALLSLLWDVARDRGLACVLEGSNASDVLEYRPGARAIAELGVRSPLQEAGLTKSEIRQLSREAGLPTWDLPPMACLATRFPYHTAITRAGLEAVAQAERSLRTLGLRLVRVRHHGTVARIEVAPGEIGAVLAAREEVVRAVKGVGYAYVALDLQGYRSGSMDEVLGNGGPQ
ncbi:MAG: ATP-dependent sacrificial sulfur transferase LarE [Bacillota bacterium]